MKKIISSVLFLTILSGCTQSEIISRVDDNVEIKLSSTALSVDGQTKGVTRTPFDGSISSSNSFIPEVFVSKSSGDYDFTGLTGTGTTNAYADGTMTFENTTDKVSFTTTGFSGKSYYPADNSIIYIIGLYPPTNTSATDESEKWAYSSDNKGFCTYTFTGCEDVMVAKQVTSKKENVLTANPLVYPNLAFNHLLTKLNIILKAERDDAITAWGKVTKIELTKVSGGTTDPCKTVSADLINSYGTTDNKTKFSESCSPFKCFQMTATTNAGVTTYTYTDDEYVSQTYDLTTTATYKAYTLMAPITLDSSTSDLTFKVYTANVTSGQSITVELKSSDGTTDFTGSTQGKAFDLTFNFKVTEIKATATVTDWTAGGSTTTDIQ